MALRSVSGTHSYLIISVLLVLTLNQSCGNRKNAGDGNSDLEPAGEPDQYSATVSRIVDDGTRREASITREARSGEMRRQEWAEQDGTRALIWRPDLGKCFLVDLNRRVYVELPLIPHAQELQSPGADARSSEASGADPDDGAFQAIDRVIDEPLSPVSVESLTLPDEVIEGHLCKVSERRASFGDGHTEVTRLFRAPDLGGLALRVEVAGAGNERVITERRQVRTEVPADTFDVPANFRKVDKLGLN